MTVVKYPEVYVRMVEEDGNAFSILSRVRRAMLGEGIEPAVIEEFLTEATSSDYDNLLKTVLRWVAVDWDRPKRNMDEDYDQDEYDWDTNHCGWCEELHQDCECEAE